MDNAPEHHSANSLSQKDLFKMPIIRVALDVPVATLFDYLASDATTHDIGVRVQVPLEGKS